MGMTLLKQLQSIFVDMTVDGERIDKNDHYEVRDDGKKVLTRRDITVRETGEILEEIHYNPETGKESYNHVYRAYYLN